MGVIQAGKPRLTEPHAHKGQTAHQHQECSPVGENFAGVVDVGGTGDRFAPDRAQVVAGVPQAEEDQRDDSPEALVDDDRPRIGTVGSEYGIDLLDAEYVEDALLNGVEQIEEAQPKGNVAVDEVGKAQHLEAEPERNLDAVAEEWDSSCRDRCGGSRENSD